MINESAPLITTIIPTYRRPKLLRRAILSALAQQGPLLQVCVFDNASGDATVDVVAELASDDPRVKYFCHPKNIGGFANFQYGLSHVTTPLFSFLSDDDVLLPGFYETAVNDFEKFPDAAFWSGVTVTMMADGTFYAARGADWPRSGLFTPPDGVLQMIRGSMPCWTSVLFKRKVISEIGLLNEKMEGASDMEYLLRNAARNSFIASKHVGALLLLHPESYSETASIKQFWPGWQGMVNSISNTIGLDDKTKNAIRHGLIAIAQRKLLRRAAAALTKKDYAFSHEAAEILSKQYGNQTQAVTLRSLTILCSKLPLLQLFYSQAYRLAEKLLIYKRWGHRKKYSHYSRYL